MEVSTDVWSSDINNFPDINYSIASLSRVLIQAFRLARAAAEGSLGSLYFEFMDCFYDNLVINSCYTSLCQYYCTISNGFARYYLYQGFSLKKYLYLLHNLPSSLLIYTLYLRILFWYHQDTIVPTTIIISSGWWAPQVAATGQRETTQPAQARHGLLQQAWRNMQQKLTCIIKSNTEKRGIN